MERESTTTTTELGNWQEQPPMRAAEEVEPADPFDRGDTEWYAVLGED
ncbi:hypothetical protein P3T36_001249 [Kitasatospora sp. MAP12-15]|nr:hypothetical protein [Kitasatospora sp. MAP12-44]MDH6114900.1 hypothetical protein [Kitasatospora sp. MAP12-44]